MATKVLDILLQLAVKGTEDAVRLQKAVEDIIAAGKKAPKRTLDEILGLAQAKVETDALGNSIKKLQIDLQNLANKVKIVDLFAKPGGTKVDFDITEASKKVDFLVSKGRQLVDVMTQAGKTRLDLDLARAAGPLDLLIVKGKQFVDLLTTQGASKLDLDLTKASKTVDVLVQKTRQFVDLIVKSGATPVDLDLSKANKTMDLLLTKTKQFIDLKVKAGATKIDIDLDKVEKDAEQANAALRRLGAIMQDLKRRAGVLPPLVTEQDKQRLAGAGGVIDSIKNSILEASRAARLFRLAMANLLITFAGREILDTVIAFDKLKQGLEAVFGSAARAKEEFAFIRAEAERLGLDIVTLTNQYTKFSIAAGSLGLSQEAIRDVFTAVAQKAALLSLSTGELEGALLALEQIASKGVVSMEELRRQLGNALPGAVTIAAKGLGITTAQLFAMVEAGQLASDVFIKSFGPALRATLGADTQTKIKTTSSEIFRFKNTLKEFTDEVIRAGVLDVFIESLKALQTILKNRENVDTIKNIANGLAAMAKAIGENISSIKLLIEAWLGFKALGFVINLLTKLSAALTLISGTQAAVALTSVGTAAAGAGTAAATATPLFVRLAAGIAATVPASSAAAVALRGFSGLVSGLASALVNPFILTIAFGGGAAVIGLKKFLDSLNEAEEKAVEFDLQMKRLASDTRLIAFFTLQAAAIDKFANVVNKSRKEISEMSRDQMHAYKLQLEGATNYYGFLLKSLSAEIDQTKAQIEILKSKAERTQTDNALLKLYEERLAALTERQGQLTEVNGKYAETLKEVNKSIKLSGLTDLTKRLQTLQGTVTLNIQSFERMSKLDFTDLSRRAQGIVQQFERMTKEGKNLAEILDKSIPDGFGFSKSEQIREVAEALVYLQQQGKATGDVITDAIAKKLDNLTGQQLLNFQQSAQASFGAVGADAQGLSTILNGTLKAALKNLHVDVEDSSGRIRKTFADMTDSLKVVATNAKATGEQLKLSIENAITSAKNIDELTLLEQKLQQVGITAQSVKGNLVDPFQRLQDKILETSGILDNSLGDSFRRLGIQTAQHLQNLADLAERDFERIRKSGLATAADLRIAFAKAFDATPLGRAFEFFGVKAIKILRDTRDTAVEYFKQMGESGEATGTGLVSAFGKVVESIRNAGGSVAEVQRAILDQYRILQEALRTAFDQGTISAFDFAKASQDAAEFVAKQWEDAFGRVQEAAETAFEAVGAMQTMGARRDFPAFDPKALRGASLDDLKKMLEDLQAQVAFQTRVGATPDPIFLKGLLAAIQQLINELNRRGERTGLPSGNVPLDPRTGNFSPTFNFSGAPDERWVRSFLIPFLDDYRRRTT